jgi:two-component sensor histidine kinase
LYTIHVQAQIHEKADITFDFNDHTLNEKNNKIKAKAPSVTFVEDRFGNNASAIYIHGHINSYLSLGTSPLLKPQQATISFWVNLAREVRTGTGYPGNPLMCTKNSTNTGWYNSYEIHLEINNKELTASNSIDSTKPEAIVHSLRPIEFNKWYHLVITFDYDTLAFYMNGELQSKSPKKFETVYLASDSVIFGHGANSTNERFSLGKFDDIQFFHRVLTPQEVGELYNAPDPNKFKRMLMQVLRYVLIALALISLMFIVFYRYRRKLKKQQEQLELHKHIAELEMKVVKTQMNPHFISNCLAAIQELIYAGNVDKAGQYLAKFSLFLRRVLDYSDKTYTSLEEELEMIKLNVELEQLRFNDNFKFSVTIENSINPREILIPSLITQPLIENAIWHGLLPLKERYPVLNISVYQKENSLFLEIEDNGVGRKKEEGKNGKISRGTKLVKDKLESISKLTQSSNYKMQIIDLLDKENNTQGTKIIMQLDNNPETD